MSLPFSAGQLILFTGDSITDSDRDRHDPASLGMGYVQLVADHLHAHAADLNLRFRNTGVSGDTTRDLLTRWDRDCIDLQTDWVSILIGINNVWQGCFGAEAAPDDLFEAEYRSLLERVRTDTSAELILCSPFLLHIDESVTRMRAELDSRIHILNMLAREYNACWVDFDAAFMAAQQRHIPSYWAEDGVHPTPEGHALLAETWLAAIMTK